LLDRTVWVDIGLGRTLGELSAKEIVSLKACKQASMGFQKTALGLAQTFYAGLALRTEYASARMRPDESGGTVFLFLPGSIRPAETLHLSRDTTVLVQQTPGFRPHTYLKCVFPPEKPPQKR
jgi:hypothetical protein